MKSYNEYTRSFSMTRIFFSITVHFYFMYSICDAVYPHDSNVFDE